MEEVEEVVADKIKIEVHSISRISTVNFTDTDAVISISSPGNLPFVNFPESTLILCFSDIEHPYKLLSIGERFVLLGAFLWRPIKVVCEMYWRRREEVKQALVPFRVSQVVCIERFIRALPIECRKLYIHCDFGRSRSAAVGAFLSEKYGLEVEYKEDGISANSWVLRLLKES